MWLRTKNEIFIKSQHLEFGATLIGWLVSAVSRTAMLWREMDFVFSCQGFVYLYTMPHLTSHPTDKLFKRNILHLYHLLFKWYSRKRRTYFNTAVQFIFLQRHKSIWILTFVKRSCILLGDDKRNKIYDVYSLPLR